MKRLMCSLSAVAIAVAMCPVASFAEQASVGIDEDAFPDEVFRSVVSLRYDIDGDEKLSEEEIADVVAMDVRGLGIEDLTGIECFTSLRELDCSENSLYALDLSSNSALITLVCEDNECEAATMSIIPGIDAGKMRNVEGGKIASIFGGIAIQYLVEEGKPASNRITYEYDCGNDFTASFAFVRPAGNAPGDSGDADDPSTDSDQNEGGDANEDGKKSDGKGAGDISSPIQEHADVRDSIDTKTGKTVAKKAALKAPKIKLKAKKRRIIVSWSKVMGATGYRIYVSKKKSGSYKLAKTVRGGRAGTFALKARKGKRVYVKVRALKKGKNVILGKMSKVRTARAR